MGLTDETCGYLSRYLNAKVHPGLPEGVDVRTEQKFLGCIVYQIFLPMVLHCARFTRESSATNSY